MAETKYSRIFSVVSDEYGIDPLRDRITPEIIKITEYTTHVVTQEERAAIDLISLNAYGTTDLWWVVLAYNGIHSYRDIVEGVVLKLPSFAAIVDVVTYKSIRPVTAQRVITI